jgi:hypothetical protein
MLMTLWPIAEPAHLPRPIGCLRSGKQAIKSTNLLTHGVRVTSCPSRIEPLTFHIHRKGAKIAKEIQE